MSRKATIEQVTRERDFYTVIYSTGSTKRMMISKAPATVTKWLAEHPEAVTEQTTEEPTVEAAAADLEPVREMEPEREVFKEDEVEGKVVMETERFTEQPAAEIPAAAVLPEESEPQPIPLKPTEDAEPVKASSPEPHKEPQRKPQQTAQSGTWPTVAEMVTVIALRAAQVSIFAVWLMIQIAIASIRLAESIPATMERARTTCRAVIKDTARAYQTAAEVVRTAVQVTTEIIMDTGHGVGRYSRIAYKAGITLVSSLQGIQ